MQAIYFPCLPVGEKKAILNGYQNLHARWQQWWNCDLLFDKAVCKIGACVTTRHLHLMENQWRVSLGEHPSSHILSSLDENRMSRISETEREKGHDNKICNNFDALKPGLRTHYNHLWEWPLSSSIFGILSHSLNIRNKLYLLRLSV